MEGDIDISPRVEGNANGQTLSPYMRKQEIDSWLSNDKTLRKCLCKVSIR